MYTKIFQDIVRTMHQDYAGCIDKAGWDRPRFYEDQIRDLEAKGGLSALTFMEIMQDYLLDFRDPHLFFQLIHSNDRKETDYGFRVRRYEDQLYVISQTGETRIDIGDAILKLDQVPVLELVHKHQRELMEQKAEREDWRKVIPKYQTAEVMDAKGNKRVLALEQYEKAEYRPKHTMERVGPETLCMTMSDFFDPNPIDRLVEQHQEELKVTKNLIIDVRKNLGGSTLSYKKLEPYLFPDGTNPIDFSFYEMTMNCTERNAALIIQSIEEDLKKIDNEEFREGLKKWKEETWEKHRGEGFVKFDEEGSQDDYEIKGLDLPKQIVVLTDNYCGSAGDVFVYLCKQSPKVTVIGRPTMGVNDYSNLCERTWNNQFKLMYSTSRLDQLDHRELNAEQGIKPHIYIPWTPEHLTRDIDMEQAMKRLNDNQ